MEDSESEFKWGFKKEVAGQEKTDFQYYDSFTWNGQSVCLYECVFFYAPGALETFVGKIVKLYETPNHERKVEVVWLFRPIEIRSHLGHVETRWNELFLASGKGKGVTNVNDVGTIIGKCNVVCISTDKRNPQLSEEDLRKADYVFYRTFDVGKDVISMKFPDEIAGIKVEFLFNRVNVQTITHQGLEKQGEQVKIFSRTELDRNRESPVKSSMSTSRRTEVLNNQTLTHQGSEKPSEQFNLPSRIEFNKSAGSPAKNSRPTGFKCTMLNGHSLTHLERMKQAEHFNTTARMGFNKGAVSPAKNNMHCSGTSAMFKGHTKQGEKFNKSTRIELRKDTGSPAKNSMPTSKSVVFKDQTVIHPALQKREAQFNLYSRIESNKGTCSSAKNDMPTSRINTVVKGSENSISVVGERGNSNASPKLKSLPVAYGIQPGREVKDMSKVRCSEVSFTYNTSDTLPLKKRPKLSDGKDSSLLEGQSKGNYVGLNANGTAEKERVTLASERGPKTCEKFVEVTRRPDSDRRNWFKQLPWEERLRKAQEAGTLVLLENLDPSFASLEVEDLVWQALKEKVQARVIEHSTFSSPLYGKAFVIFKSKVAAETAIYELNRRYLVLGDGRPVCARRRNLRAPDKETCFFGHLVLEKHKYQRQNYEMRNAVSTAHCSQPNTMEYDFALQWLELQEKSDLQWKALYKEQLKEITEVKSRLKLSCDG